MNTAQCVTLGHKSFSYGEGHSADNIFVVARFIFEVSTSLIFTWAVLGINRLSGMDENIVSAMFLSIHFLSVLCSVYFFVVRGITLHLSVNYFFTTYGPLISCIFLHLGNDSFTHLYSSDVPEEFIPVIIFLYVFGGNAISSICCWLLIGIRINPSWGLTVALSVISTLAASTYGVYLYLEVSYPNGYNIRGREITLKALLWGTYSLPNPSFRSRSDSRDDNSQRNNTDAPNRVIAFLKSYTFSERQTTMVVCVTGCIAVGCLFAVVVLPGPSIGGQTAAEEFLKTSSLYFITAFIAWATWRKHASIELIFRAPPLENERPQNPEGQDTDRHMH